jgi:hypothetical protein
LVIDNHVTSLGFVDDLIDRVDGDTGSVEHAAVLFHTKRDGVIEEDRFELFLVDHFFEGEDGSGSVGSTRDLVVREWMRAINTIPIGGEGQRGTNIEISECLPHLFEPIVDVGILGAGNEGLVELLSEASGCLELLNDTS